MRESLGIPNSIRVLMAVAVSAAAYAPPAWGQAGYSEVQVEALATGEEISNQPGLWVMEVYFKPMRLIVVDVTNPQTGRKEPQYVWYIPYRAINRPLASPTVQNPPVNELDAPVLPAKFIPEFTLVTTDGEAPKIYQDRVIPEALAEIKRRERREYKSSVSVVTDVPPPAKSGEPDEQVIYGVATFTGIDPEADKYTVYLTGFSNGVQTAVAPDGSAAVHHKTIEMKYWRPGDRFDQQEPEIRMEGVPRWIYR